MTAKRYTFVLAFMTVVILMVAASFNYIVNPYLFFSVNRIDGFNAFKSDIGSYIYQSKAYFPLEMSIDTLLIGNSRVEMGLDPEHPCLSPATFNLGLPGDDVELRIAYALNLMRQKPSIKHLIVSVDFTDFVRDVGAARVEAFKFSGQERLQYYIDGRLNSDYRWARLQDYYIALFSLDAAVSSVKTVLGQKVGATTRTGKGFNPAQDLALATQIEGSHTLFAQTLSRLQNTISPEMEYQTPPLFSTVDYRALDELIRYAREQSIHIDFFINPLHRSFFDAVDRAGMRDDYQRWRRDIEHFILRNDDQSLTFNDFNQIESMTDEALPEPGSFKPLRWFWEPVHYNKALGDTLLDKLTKERCQADKGRISKAY